MWVGEEKSRCVLVFLFRLSHLSPLRVVAYLSGPVIGQFFLFGTLSLDSCKAAAAYYEGGFKVGGECGKRSREGEREETEGFCSLSLSSLAAAFHDQLWSREQLLDKLRKRRRAALPPTCYCSSPKPPATESTLKEAASLSGASVGFQPSSINWKVESGACT